jgi:hypothetical protein
MQTQQSRNSIERLGRSSLVIAALAALAGAPIVAGGVERDASKKDGRQISLAAKGKHIFRFDTFGDEAKWTEQLRMHEVIRTAVDPITALSVGLKVDADALPETVVAGIKDGTVDLHSPATTVALLKLNAVVGFKGKVESIGGVDTHSTVDNSFAPGIGKRLDGWSNRDLNPGAIIALSPAVQEPMKTLFRSWGLSFLWTLTAPDQYPWAV